MDMSINFIERSIVLGVKRLISWLKIPDHVFELSAVVIVLVFTAIVSGRELVEWLGVFGVILTFEYTLIATRLGENEEHGTQEEKKYFKRLLLFYYLKELVWLAYFIILGAWSAIVGVVIFLLYGGWRIAWHKHSPDEQH